MPEGLNDDPPVQVKKSGSSYGERSKSGNLLAGKFIVTKSICYDRGESRYVYGWQERSNVVMEGLQVKKSVRSYGGRSESRELLLETFIVKQSTCDDGGESRYVYGAKVCTCMGDRRHGMWRCKAQSLS
jgi:hypothetical protein